MTDIMQSDDKVTALIKHCHGSRDNAEDLFQHLIAEKALSVDLPEETVSLTQEEHDEFVERYSAEVEPTIWESKRLKN
jgi:hypothetical protein